MSWFRLKHHFSGAPAWPFRPPVVPQDKLYPLHTGGVEAVGEGRGRGYNLNVPLPPGSGWGAYDAAMQRVVAPALRAFKPDLIVVSSGSGENVWRGRYFGSSRFFLVLVPLSRQALTLRSWTRSASAGGAAPSAAAATLVHPPSLTGRMMLTSVSYGRMTRQLLALADELCGGR